MTSEPTTMVGHALKYAAMGLPVFPVGADKRPFPGTHGFKDASTDPTTIKRMWRDRPDANIGVRTGPESGWYVVDVDVAEGKLGESSLADLEREHGTLPDTLCQRTGRGGWQYIFRYPQDGGVYPNTESKLALHVDTRGDGGYTIVPPSVTTGTYTWCEEYPPAELPAWMAAKLRRVETLPPSLPAEPTDDDRSVKMFRSWAAKADTTSGQRNKRAFVIACEGLGRGLPKHVVADVVLEYCQRSGLPADEGTACLNSAASSPRTGNGLPMPTQEQIDAMGDWPAKPGAEPDAAAVAVKADPATSDDEEGNRAHKSLVRSLEKFFAEGHLAVDAVGGWRLKATWELTDFTIPRLANLFAMEYRDRCKVTRSYVIETMETMVDLWSNERRREILSKFFGHAKTVDGVQLLQTFVLALTGDLHEHDVAVLRHWLWCIKRKMAGLRVEHHIMPILQGRQGSGKSVAIRMLLAPLRELWKPCSASMLTDARETQSLSTYYVGFWDEMEGVEKVAAEALKQTITAEEKAYRPMHTNRDAVIPVRCSFIAATNEEVAGLVGDTTGGRRFYEIKTLDRCDWASINGIDMVELWRSVDETEAAPILPYLDEIRAKQHGLRKLDSVAMWLDDEDWRARSCHNRDTGEKVAVSALPVEGEPFEMARLRYVDWCCRHGERPLGTGHFSRRIAAEGIETHWYRVAGAPRRRLYRPGTRASTGWARDE